MGEPEVPNAREVGFRCLVHPASLISILGLLVNDHVLKGSWPSWVTGKLSDFFGIFFFPFLVAFFLSTLFPRARSLNARWVGGLSFGATALAFAFAKATPLGHFIAVTCLAAAFGNRFSLVLDPTDLIALISLFPAWRLWQKLSTTRRATSHRIWRFAVVVLAFVASMATSYITPWQRLEHLRKLRHPEYTARLTCSSGERHVEYDEKTGVLTEWCEVRGWLGPRYMEGPWVEWYPGVQIRRIHAEYADDKLEGSWIERHPNGRVKYAGLYEKGRRVKLWRE